MIDVKKCSSYSCLTDLLHRRCNNRYIRISRVSPRETASVKRRLVRLGQYCSIVVDRTLCRLSPFDQSAICFAHKNPLGVAALQFTQSHIRNRNLKIGVPFYSIDLSSPKFASDLVNVRTRGNDSVRFRFDRRRRQWRRLGETRDDTTDTKQNCRLYDAKFRCCSTSNLT